MPVPSHLMTGGGRFSEIVDLPFPVPSSLPFFYLPHPFSLPSIAFTSPPLPSPSLPLFPRGASDFLDEAYPAKTENWRDVAPVR